MKLVFVTISVAVVLALLMPYADSLPHGEGLQSMQNQGYNWHHEHGIQSSLDPQKNGQEMWQRELVENGYRNEKWQNEEQGENWHQRQERLQLPYKETTAQRADLQNKRSERPRLQRWQIENWPNEQQFEKDKYRRQEELFKHDETQIKKEWQEQQQKERKYEQQKQENLNWQQSQAIPIDPRRQYTQWQNIPQLHQAQGQPIIPQAGAHKYYYPDKQLRYHQQGEWPRPYTYQAPALHPEIYHNARDFPFPAGHPKYETNKNAYAENQQIINDQEDGSKVQITHIPILNTPGSKLIPFPFPYNVANTHVGSQRINEQQKLSNSNIQLVKKRQDTIRSDADAIVENRYQQDLKLRREPQLRPQMKPKQSLIDKEITETRIKSESSSEPESVNDQSRLTAGSNVQYNNLNEIQKNSEYRLLNKQLQPNEEKPDRNEPKKEPKEAPSITFTSPRDILNDKQQTIKPQEQENKTPNTNSIDDLTLVVGQTRDQNEDRKLVPQKSESNDQVADEKNDTTQSIKYRRNRRRRQKSSQREENNKLIETAIEKLTVGEDTSKINVPAKKLFENTQQLRTQSTQDSSANKDIAIKGQNEKQKDTKTADNIKSVDDKSNSVETTKNMQLDNSNIFGKTAITIINDELYGKVLRNNDERDETTFKEEQSNDDTNDTDNHKSNDDFKDQKTKKALGKDSSVIEDEPNGNDNEDPKTKRPLDDNDDGDRPNDNDDDSKENTKKVLDDDDDDFIDGDESNDDEDDFKDQSTKKLFDSNENDSVKKYESEITVRDTTKTEQNGQVDESINDKEFVPSDDKDDVTTLATAQPIENVWYSIVDYYYGDDSLTNKTINTDTNEDEIPTIDFANILAAEIINSLIPSNYANTFNFIRIIATNAMRGRDGIKNIIKEPVIKGYVSQITEIIIPIYLKVKSFVEPQAYRNCKAEDLVQEKLDI